MPQKLLSADIKNSEISRNDFELNIKAIKEVKNENRKNWFHIITHILAVTIIFVFLLVMCYSLFALGKIELPDYFIAIVSMVVGFYFSKSLFT